MLARDAIASAVWDDPNVVAQRTLAARAGRTRPFPRDLHADARAAIEAAGIAAPYAHQADAFAAFAADRDVLLATGTASGKSLAYHMATLDLQARDGQATALYLFPTKALAHDQAAQLRAYPAQATAGAAVAHYDGDTPTSRRSAVRASVRTLLTNPDMLHAGVLPHHTLWRRWLAHLELVVVDEVHAYRGVFGSHVANVLRRLRRVARHYGRDPRFIGTSATIGNAGEHAAALFGREPVTIEEDAAPKPERRFALLNPPMLDAELGVRRSALQEAVRLSAELGREGRQVLTFAASRKGVEEARMRLRDAAPELPSRAYRSGLLAHQRRDIEAELRGGEARLVVATNALELGIDVGGMDAVVIAGYPGSQAALRQQAGRAGRREHEGLAVLVLGDGPLDQYLARHPEVALDGSVERALVNPDHLLIALDHLRCALFELPFEPGERFGGFDADEVAELLAHLEDSGEVHRAQGRAYWMAARYPAEAVSLRATGGGPVTLIREDGAVIGTVDAPSARWMVHPRAIYLHEGESFEVRELDLEAGRAVLAATGDAYLTEASRRTELAAAGPFVWREAPGARVFRGELTVTEEVYAFRRMLRASRQTLGRYPLELPPSERLAAGYGFVPSEPVLERLRASGAWSNDPNAYGPDWSRTRARIRRRDGFVCRLCGAPEAELPHHVHHKEPFRMFASAQEANRPENLVTLCPPCHQRAERAVRVRSGLAATAHLIRHLSPLLLMCASGDLGVHSDPAAPLAEGRPVIVVYEQVPGGVGFADELYRRHETLLAAALETVRGCPCRDGCPSCVGPAGELGHAGKPEAAALLEELVSP